MSRTVDLPTPGSPPTRTSGHESPAEHAIELGDAGRDAVALLGLDLDESEQRPRGRVPTTFVPTL